ncbi:DNA-(apurinic or apyrimidinic site) endonuclease 2 isoform X2 [Magnolia sinica]|uniref:DNA-(apurinic or apyrimidinic site) endonuclease 2 isoform X2 n=1 Tax=Magnolia sinica TaxID=86752 RepID=UPI002659BE7A|nr:DNA-(apurinic or apyrimidinic site) endonuclease 2 isoform X2 [Magnolia sinica]
MGMKIVTYNVNGLKQRIAQYGSLLKFLNSLQADIICIQETKVSRHDLSADLFMAEGYEAFFSCTRTFGQGRVAYSGVATFCRVKSAFSSDEVALPLAAEEGFTGLLKHSKSGDDRMGDCPLKMPIEVEGLEEITKEDLLKMDSEGRCIITDHGHFVLFNLYGPRADCDDKGRIDFKFNFFKTLQKRWESLLSQGRRVFVVGDLNIAPAAIDRWNAGPEFEENMFRKWMRSLLRECGGPFSDVFRTKHPHRIDHILIAGPCLHQNHDIEVHNLLDCHVEECDILTQFKRWKPDSMPRWKGGRSIRLEGSDHAPVYVCLGEMPSLPVHSTPPLAARYVPEVRGWQQTIVSLLAKQREVSVVMEDGVLCSTSEVTIENCSENVKESFYPIYKKIPTSDQETQGPAPSTNKYLDSVDDENVKENSMIILRNERIKSISHSCMKKRKKARNENCSQRTLTSFFQKKPSSSVDVGNAKNDILHDQVDISKVNPYSFHVPNETCSPNEDPIDGGEGNCSQNDEFSINPISQGQTDTNSCCSLENENGSAALEWQRIQQLMQRSIPLCNGHGEPCVVRSVKKAGPNLGRGFYVCARAKGPTSNPEASCNHFQWASSKFSRKKR